MLPEGKFSYLGSKYEIYLKYSKSTHQIGDIGEIDPSTNISKIILRPLELKCGAALRLKSMSSAPPRKLLIRLS